MLGVGIKLSILLELKALWLSHDVAKLRVKILSLFIQKAEVNT